MGLQHRMARYPKKTTKVFSRALCAAVRDVWWVTTGWKLRSGGFHFSARDAGTGFQNAKVNVLRNEMHGAIAEGKMATAGVIAAEVHVVERRGIVFIDAQGDVFGGSH